MKIVLRLRRTVPCRTVHRASTFATHELEIPTGFGRWSRTDESSMNNEILHELPLVHDGFRFQEGHVKNESVDIQHDDSL